jgi:hypothetical protein
MAPMGYAWERAAGGYEYTFVGRGGVTGKRIAAKMATRGWELVPPGSGFAGDGYTFRRPSVRR